MKKIMTIYEYTDGTFSVSIKGKKGGVSTVLTKEDGKALLKQTKLKAIDGRGKCKFVYI